ncbi:hypothetical protein LINPERPRIM_LOCUS38789 [Linum perenne]
MSCSSSSSFTYIYAPHSLCSGSSSVHRAVHRRSKLINYVKIRAIVLNWCRKLSVNCDLMEAKVVQVMDLCSGRLGRVSENSEWCLLAT